MFDVAQHGAATPPLPSHPWCPGASSLLKSNFKKELGRKTVEESLCFQQCPCRGAAVPCVPPVPLCYCQCHVTNPLSMPTSRWGNKRGKVRTLPINRSPALVGPPAAGLGGFAGLVLQILALRCSLSIPILPGHTDPCGKAVLGEAGVAHNPLQVHLSLHRQRGIAGFSPEIVANTLHFPGNTPWWVGTDHTQGVKIPSIRTKHGRKLKAGAVDPFLARWICKGVLPSAEAKGILGARDAEQ